jgi:hypothetical protein
MAFSKRPLANYLWNKLPQYDVPVSYTCSLGNNHPGIRIWNDTEIKLYGKLKNYLGLPESEVDGAPTPYCDTPRYDHINTVKSTVSGLIAAAHGISGYSAACDYVYFGGNPPTTVMGYGKADDGAFYPVTTIAISGRMGDGGSIPPLYMARTDTALAAISGSIGTRYGLFPLFLPEDFFKIYYSSPVDLTMTNLLTSGTMAAMTVDWENKSLHRNAWKGGDYQHYLCDGRYSRHDPQCLPIGRQSRLRFAHHS